MSPLSLFYALYAVLAGALFPMQTSINAQLACHVGGPVAATAVSFAVGLVSLVTLNAIAFRQYPSLSDVAGTPLPVLMAGGVLGATYLCSNVFLAPRLGAAATLCFVVAGQVVAALVIDYFGLFGLEAREATPGRILGVALVLVGAALVRLM